MKLVLLFLYFRRGNWDSLPKQLARLPIFSVWWSLAWSLSVWLQIELFGTKLQKYFVTVKNLQFLEGSLRASYGENLSLTVKVNVNNTRLPYWWQHIFLNILCLVDNQRRCSVEIGSKLWSQTDMSFTSVPAIHSYRSEFHACWITFLALEIHQWAVWWHGLKILVLWAVFVLGAHHCITAPLWIQYKCDPSWAPSQEDLCASVPWQVS